MDSENEMRERDRVSYGYVSAMHAVPDAPAVDVYANGLLVVRELAFGEYTNYLRIPVGTYEISIFVAGTRTNPVLTRMLTLARNQIFTVAAAGTLDTINLLAIRDADVPEVEDKGLVRFIHLSPNAPAVDITLADGTMLFKDVAFKEETQYTPVDDKVYTLQVRVAGTGNVVLTVPRVDIREGGYYTIYAIGFVGKQPGLEALIVPDGVMRDRVIER